MSSLAAIGILILMVITVLGGLLALAHALTRYNLKTSSSSDKQKAYECGLIGVPSSSSRIPSNFYLIAILFVLFDIEIIFLYPWALAYRDFLEKGQGMGYFIAFVVFLAVFALGLFWEIRVKALNWK